MPLARRATNAPPPGFFVDRNLGHGRYGLLKVFPGLDVLPAIPMVAERDPGGLKALLGTQVEVVGEDVWMYVAPQTLPKPLPRGWNPVISGEADVVIIGSGHLVESPEILLYLDILHELCHVAQRHRGIDLWDPTYDYVDRPSELDAYGFVVAEAKKLGATRPFLKEYLRVEWISEEDYLRLLKKMGVSEE